MHNIEISLRDLKKHMKDKFRDDLNRETGNYSSDSIKDFQMSRRYFKRRYF